MEDHDGGPQLREDAHIRDDNRLAGGIAAKRRALCERRVQFGKPTIDMPGNQTKIADLIIRLKLARLATYYTAYLWDLGWDITVESNVTKVFNVEGTMQSSLDAVQVMGGDGVTPFYPAQSILEIAKVEHISGGTMEACRMVIFKSGVKQLEKELKMRRRVIHEALGVPCRLKNFIAGNERG